MLSAAALAIFNPPSLCSHWQVDGRITLSTVTLTQPSALVIARELRAGGPPISVRVLQEERGSCSPWPVPFLPFHHMRAAAGRMCPLASRKSQIAPFTATAEGARSRC